MADRAEELGLAVPDLADETKTALRRVVPAFGSVKNPVDITAQFIAAPSLLRSALEIVLRDPRVDAAIFYLGLMERFADQVVANLSAVHTQVPKPLLVAWAAAPEAGLAALRERGICVLPTATRAVNALRGLVEYAEARRRFREELAGAATRASSPRGALGAVIGGPRATGRRILTTGEAFALLSAYGIRVARSQLSRTKSEAVRAAEEFGGPVALKIESAAIQHKTEANALRLNVSGPDQVARAYEELMAGARAHAPDAEIQGVLVQEMVPEGVEIVVGLHRDPQFGPVVMVGLGGIFVEVLEDVAFRAAPLTRRDAEEMLEELRGRKILEGARGRPRGDIRSLIDVLLAVSRLAMDAVGQVAELDINPLIVLSEGSGAVVVDALTILAESHGS